MRLSALAGLLLLITSARLAATGGTPEAWLGGTLPWDSMGYCEADLELHADGADGDSAYGLGTQLGLTDWLQAGVQGRWSADGQRAPLGLVLQAREPFFRGASLRRFSSGWLIPPLAAYGRWRWDGGRWQGRAGLIAVLLPFAEMDSSTQLNVEAGPEGAWGLGLGFWTPYLSEMLRLGVEWRRDAASGGSTQDRWVPQVLLNGPGDLSLSVGVSLDPSGDRAPRYSTRLSWILFPNP